MLEMEEYSVPVAEDNHGAIKLANNLLSSKRTRHMDIKHNFIRDAVVEETRGRRGE